MSVKTEDRANQILHMLLRHGRASIDDLIRELETSAPNIRRDLAKLERRGLVCRTHGGAELFGPQIYVPFRFDAEFQTREERFVKEKRRIALAANSFKARDCFHTDGGLYIREKFTGDGHSRAAIRFLPQSRSS